MFSSFSAELVLDILAHAHQTGVDLRHVDVASLVAFAEHETQDINFFNKIHMMCEPNIVTIYDIKDLEEENSNYVEVRLCRKFGGPSFEEVNRS